MFLSIFRFNFPIREAMSESAALGSEEGYNSVVTGHRNVGEIFDGQGISCNSIRLEPVIRLTSTHLKSNKRCQHLASSRHIEPLLTKVLLLRISILSACTSVRTLHGSQRRLTLPPAYFINPTLTLSKSASPFAHPKRPPMTPRNKMDVDQVNIRHSMDTTIGSVP